MSTRNAAIGVFSRTLRPLQLHDAQAGSQSGLEFGRVHGLDQIIVGPGFQPVHDILLLSLGRQEDHACSVF